MRITLLASLALTLPFATGCAGGDANYASPSAFYTDYESALCALMVRCGILARAQRTNCVASIDAAWVGSQKVYSVDDAVSRGRVAFDGAMARSCLDTLRTRACRGGKLIACTNVFEGLVSPGGACRSDAECVNGYCGGSTTDGCAGTCIAFSPTGAACTSDRNCADTNYCDDSRKCATRLGVGATCTSFAQCQEALACIAGKCIAISRIGTAQAGEICNPGIIDCAPTLFCDTAAMQPLCKTPLAQGRQCTNQLGCQDGLTCIGLRFDGRTVVPGQCGPFLDAGQSCEPMSVSNGCPEYAPCNPASKTCQARDPVAGDPCQTDYDCRLGGLGTHFCNALQKCATQADLNETCDPAAGNACLESVCDPTTKVCALDCG